MKLTPWALAVTALVASSLALGAPVHGALAPLPADGSQVNDDPANSIDPQPGRRRLATSPAAPSRRGRSQVPWATFEQKVGSSQQIFVRAFKNGAWVTQGFPASLNIDPTKEAEAPSIDFAGAGRTVPWVAWYEPNDALRRRRPTSSRAASTPARTCGCRRARTGPRARLMPSLNIHTDRTAEDPSVAGGATVAGNDPVPWVVWKENDGAATDDAAHVQIFVVEGREAGDHRRRRAPGSSPPAANNVNGFCWQQVGLDRLDPASPQPVATGDPTLNIDPTRDGAGARHRVHRRERHRRLERLVRGGDDGPLWPAQQPEVFAAKIVSDTGGRRRLPLAGGRQRHRRPEATSSTRRARRMASAPAPSRRRPRTRAR